MKKFKILLYPISLIYGITVGIRNILFDIGILDSRIYKIPTIGVGNLSIGGTGKSILVDYLINLFKSNYNITTLSRGYNRDTKGFVHADSKSTAYEIGDEPFQFYSKHPEINVVVCEDRRKGMNIILKKLPQTELCIWDDIYQHRFVKPGLMILTTTYDKPYTKDKILPLGKLRESISSSKRADVILINKCPVNISNLEREKFTNSLNLFEHQKVYYSSLTYSEEIKSKSISLDINHLKEKDFVLVTGIADSSYLVKFLKDRNLVFSHLKYKDHYNYSKSSIDKIKRISEGKYILTTEKDFGKLKLKIDSDNLFYIEVSLKFLNDNNELDFDNLIEKYVNPN
ncbi:MAG: tetraacyldisaccharide 4'-kinase [Bacteroidota bacterium]|nr:tetraacyldisaccharide 4'-kinase [Bacteroidota bacterium]|tara:strand:+ start:1772 stop:2797 length:1026 start_codon:yes stop_codon:yes gene_type:complete